MTADGLRNMVLSVKGGKLTPAYVRELVGTVTTPGCGTMGGFICLEEPRDQGHVGSRSERRQMALQRT